MPQSLPACITQDAVKTNVFYIDPDIAYPAMITKLEQIGSKTGATDQYWLESVFQITKIIAQGLINDAGLDPRPSATLNLSIRSDGGRKDRWGLTTVPKGRGLIAATKGREARQTHAQNSAPLRAALIAAHA